MTRFTKHNNPNKKRKKKSYNDRWIDATKEMLTDKKLGYEIPSSFYKEKVRAEQ